MTETLLTPDEFARIAGIKRETADMWRHRGCGPRFVKVGRLVRYRESDVNAWIHANTVTSTSAANAKRDTNNSSEATAA